MTVKELFDVIPKPSRLHICREKESIYNGFLGMLEYNDITRLGITGEEKVKEFKAIPEIRHRLWKEKGLCSPMEPDETPDYAFSDLEMKLYYTIFI